MAPSYSTNCRRSNACTSQVISDEQHRTTSSLFIYNDRIPQFCPFLPLENHSHIEYTQTTSDQTRRHFDLNRLSNLPTFKNAFLDISSPTQGKENVRNRDERTTNLPRISVAGLPVHTSNIQHQSQGYATMDLDRITMPSLAIRGLNNADEFQCRQR